MLNRGKHYLSDMKGFIIFFVIYLFLYMLSGKLDMGEYHLVQSSLDERIPFIPEFAIAYFMWFLYWPFCFIYLYRNDRDTYFLYAWILAIGMGTMIIISYVYPNTNSLRPEPDLLKGFMGVLLGFVYDIDSPKNLLPSIHVYNSLAVMVAVSVSKLSTLKRWKLRLVIYLIGALIIVSTVFVKQHSWIDGAASIVLCTIVSGVILRVRRKKTRDVRGKKDVLVKLGEEEN